MPQYALPRHVFVCMQGEHVVFLDVRKDRYFALEAARTAGLGEWVAGWPVAAPIANGIARRAGGIPIHRDSVGVDRESLGAVMSLLVEKEILTSAGEGKPAIPEPVDRLRGELCVEGFDEQPRVRIGRFLTFVSASVRARLLLKHRTFESVVARVKRRIELHRSHEPAADESCVQELVSTFAFLRPYFFAAKDACLFDALALSEYLAAYRVYPRWVFGVQARPFAAHCWLQLNGIVLNDTLDHVRRYAPIMVV
jgi:hypothetical protein